MKIKKKIANVVVIFFTTLVLTIVVLEISYRYQWFDFYKAELKGLNTQEILNSDKSNVLVCGDSFTASPESYVKILREKLSSHAVVNAAVPGTCILQHVLYMPGRIKKMKPDVFIYQFYIGNDLFDISHPVSSPNISLARKTYWWISDRLLSVSFLNFRFAGIRYKYYDDAGGAYKPKENEIFSVDAYSKREKFNNLAEPDLLDNTLNLENGRDKDWTIFETKFRLMIKNLDNQCKKYFVLIPHQAQISAVYCENNTKLGARYRNPLKLVSTNDQLLYAKIKTLCQETGFVLIDPLNEFKINNQYAPLYYANDPHLNNFGHHVLADMILNEFN